MTGVVVSTWNRLGNKTRPAGAIPRDDVSAGYKYKFKFRGQSVITKKHLTTAICTIIVCGSALAQEAAPKPKPKPVYGKYPMSLLRRCRTAKPVGKNHLSVAVKVEYCDQDEIKSGGSYKDLESPNKFDKLMVVPVAKYGYIKDAHVAVGVPYIWTELKSSKKDIDDDHIGNVFVFHKWNCIKESETIPGIALDVWYYFDTGEPQCKAGTDNDSVKFTTEISKAWKWFNVHLNPGYRIDMGGGSDVVEINAGTYVRLTKAIRPCVEYNYIHKDSKGECHDIVPGLLWIIKPGHITTKIGAIVNLDSSMTYRDEIGGVFKLFGRY